MLLLYQRAVGEYIFNLGYHAALAAYFNKTDLNNRDFICYCPKLTVICSCKVTE